MCDSSTMFEEVSLKEKTIFDNSVNEYVKKEGLAVLDDLYPLSTRAQCIPHPLFVEIN